MKSKIYQLTTNNIAVGKKTILLLLLAFTFGCDNNDDKATSNNPIDQLPPVTQVGANKVGCLIDGEVFLPDSRPNSTNCFYQLVDGEYYFALALSKRDSFNNLIALNLGTNSKQIAQGEQYQLLEYISGNASAAYIFNLTESFTNNINTGNLTITRLTDQFVSGTFWFDVEDSNGVVHRVREGRFDMQYTQ
ncbi:MAG: hypothetical protein EOP48_03885 [Sphingobacteriales bacterium]|nr:MAG: hypothetical protein EOP48_03885 [Sphingobacteriales bacterium]